jgi:hypothetical protein
LENCSRGDGSQADDKLGLQNVQLLLKEWAASGDFVIGRRSIAGRSTFQRIEDEEFVTLHLGGGDNLVEQLSGRTDKRDALSIFFGTWRFTEQDDARLKRPDAENGLFPRASQFLAKSAVLNYFAQRNKNRLSFGS